MKKLLAILIGFIFSTILCYGQIEINHETLMKHKVDSNIYEFGVLGSAFSEIPCMRDYREMQLEISINDSLTQKEIYKSGDSKTKSLKVLTESILIDTLNKILNIKGYVTGGWYGAGSDVQIYIGQRVDTISPLTLTPSPGRTTLYNGKKITEPIIIKYYPAFYLKNFSHFKSEVGYNDHKERTFKITSEFNESSILIFGLFPDYTEIFEIGRLLIDLKTEKPLKTKK